MSNLRPMLREITRPHLSTRFRLLNTRRKQSTAPIAASLDKPTTAPPPPKPSVARRYRAVLIWSSLALLLGLGAGQFVMHTFVPPTMPEAGSREDDVLMQDLNKRIEGEFIIKVLRGKCLGVSKALKGDQTGWVEIIPNTGAANIAGAGAAGAPGNGGELMRSLRGAKGLGVERLFWDSGEQKLVAVVWLGGSLSGWPGVAHGGLLATVMTEKIALANALANGAASAVENAAAPQRLPGSGNHATMALPATVPHEPAQVSIDYIKPTYAHSFHVIRVSPSYPPLSSDDPSYVRLPISDPEWVATLETLKNRKICVKAAAKFEPRSQAERARERVGDVARGSYREFREWLWPSRQQQSQSG